MVDGQARPWPFRAKAVGLTARKKETCRTTRQAKPDIGHPLYYPSSRKGRDGRTLTSVFLNDFQLDKSCESHRKTPFIVPIGSAINGRNFRHLAGEVTL